MSPRAFGLWAAFALASCGKDERLLVEPGSGGSGGFAGTPAGGGNAGSSGSGGAPKLASVGAERLFPTQENPGISLDDCLFGSPLAFERDGSTEIVVALGEHVVGVEPLTGQELYRVKLPASGAERAFVISTPVLVGQRLIVAYHTTEAPNESKKPGRDVMDLRKSQRVAVVDLAQRALDPAFPPLTLAAEEPAATPGKTVLFRADKALQRGALVHVPEGGELGVVAVAFGNGRDLQPWHGWMFEVSLDAWSSLGAAQAVSRVRLITPEHDCGPEGSSGSRTRICGGGLWSPSGVLLVNGESGPELILPAGNGQLDLPRGDFANTLLRVRPGVAFDPGCDAAACAAFDPDQPALACVESCNNLFVPRVPAGDPALVPESGVCDGLGMFECWEKLDYVGGSTPVLGQTPGGKQVLLSPTKDGHVYVVDAEHLGTLHQRKKLVDVCGAKGHNCQADWAGMIVTQPTPAKVGGAALFVVPTFMPDSVHTAGVFGLELVDGAKGPELVTRWVFPEPESLAAKQRFRWHPSRATVATLLGEDTVWLVEPGTVDQIPGRLIGLRASDGSLLVDQKLAGRGFRFTKPLFHAGVLYTPSCNADFGPGTLEAHRLVPK
ncbi:MAG: hypothetical protein IPM35_36935 [Myxococcales bacterium]|nr:hypothetical protein [Myxococcales bacterium]